MNREILVTLLSIAVGVLPTKMAYAEDPQDRAAIERLHQQDIAATLADDADQLAKLWDEDAVRLQSGSPPEVGKATIYANDKRWQANLHCGHTLSYKPDLKDLQIVD